MIGWVGPSGDMHDAVLILGQQVEPPRLVMAHVALLLQPLEARVVRMQLEGLVQQVGPKCLEGVYYRQELQHVGRVRALGLGQLARLEGYRMELARIVGLIEDGRHCEL